MIGFLWWGANGRIITLGIVGLAIFVLIVWGMVRAEERDVEAGKIARRKADGRYNRANRAFDGKDRFE